MGSEMCIRDRYYATTVRRLCHGSSTYFSIVAAETRERTIGHLNTFSSSHLISAVSQNQFSSSHLFAFFSARMHACMHPSVHSSGFEPSLKTPIQQPAFFAAGVEQKGRFSGGWLASQVSLSLFLDPLSSFPHPSTRMPPPPPPHGMHSHSPSRHVQVEGDCCCHCMVTYLFAP